MTNEAPPKGRGGARPGAGRPKGSTAKTRRVEEDYTMLELLQQVALGRLEISPLQLKAATTAVQYTSVKSGDGGKTEARQAEADKVNEELPQTPAPRLQVIN